MSDKQGNIKQVYEPTWESLDQHRIPGWFNDGKFGIFIHWGVYAVPAYHEWYVTFMSPKACFGRNLGGPPYTASPGDLEEHVFKANIREDAYNYQRKRYGPDFAYDDFIPMFKAERFAPEPDRRESSRLQPLRPVLSRWETRCSRVRAPSRRKPGIVPRSDAAYPPLAYAR